MKYINRLKILFIPTWFPSKQNMALGIFIKEHARAVSLYNDVVVLYNELIDHPTKHLYKIEDNIEDGIRTLRLRYRKSSVPRTSYFLYLWSIFRGFRKLMYEGWKPDIIHANVFSAGVPAVILGKIYKIPVVITEHWTGFPRHVLGKYDILKVRFAFNKAKIILPVSKDLEEAIKSYNIKNKFEIVPNVVNTKIFYPSLRQKYSNEQKKILLVALLSPQKGVSYLLQSLAKVGQKRQDFILDIVGDGPNRVEYEKLTKNLGLNGYVKFHGLKSKSEVAEFMRKSDFFIQPSLCETFGVGYVEAMACGKPIIATRLSVLQEIINKNIGILVPPKDIEALTNAINYMLDHYRDYSSEKISQYAKKNFSYKVIGKKIDDIYRKIII